MPGVGTLTPDQLAALSQVSCEVVDAMENRLQWVETFVTGNKLYCIYLAPNEATVREHTRRCKLPIDSVNLVHCTIGPPYAEVGDA